jgi:hypothetical protein
MGFPSSLKSGASSIGKALVVVALLLLTLGSGLAFILSGALGDPGDPVFVLLLFALAGVASLIVIARFPTDWRAWCLGVAVLAMLLAYRTIALGSLS